VYGEYRKKKVNRIKSIIFAFFGGFCFEMIILGINLNYEDDLLTIMSLTYISGFACGMIAMYVAIK
jgi:hypothetical protein